MFKIGIDSWIGDFVYAKSRLSGLSIGRASANAVRAEDRYNKKERSKEHYDKFAEDVNLPYMKSSKLFQWYFVKDWRKTKKPQ